MSTETLRVGDVAVELPRADKPLFPDGITKAELAEYYRFVAARMLPYVRDRPLAMERYPDGIDGERVFQKHTPDYFPEWITRVTVPKQGGGSVSHVVCDQEATLVYLAAQASLTPHVFLSRRDRLDHPDQMVFDLDPPDAGRFDRVRECALRLRAVLADELGLVSFVKTSGSTGLHVHVPLDRRHSFDPVRDFARAVASLLVARAPDRYTIEHRLDRRGDRVYIDVLRNAYAQTVVAPYALRARPGAPAARPLSWERVADPELRPDQFTLRTVAEWFGEDPWSGMARHAHQLDQAGERLAALRRRPAGR